MLKPGEMLIRDFYLEREKQSTTVSNNVGSIVRNLGINQLSSVLKNTVQSSLGFDVVEISGGKTWKSGQVKVGKYVTKNLYLSYEQNFRFDKLSRSLDAETINLEYQLLRSLFIRASNRKQQSGFDLIFKYSWK